MPRGDGTGPGGMGPMTGRVAGFCAGYSVPGYMNPGYGRGAGFGFGRGLGRGFGRGFGRGWAPGMGSPFYGNPYAAPYYPAGITPEQEAEMLKAQAGDMKAELETLNQRIKELESAKASGDDK